MIMITMETHQRYEDTLKLVAHEAVDDEVGWSIQDEEPVHETKTNLDEEIILFMRASCYLVKQRNQAGGVNWSHLQWEMRN